MAATAYKPAVLDQLIKGKLKEATYPYLGTSQLKDRWARPRASQSTSRWLRWSVCKVFALFPTTIRCLAFREASELSRTLPLWFGTLSCCLLSDVGAACMGVSDTLNMQAFCRCFYASCINFHSFIHASYLCRYKWFLVHFVCKMVIIVIRSLAGTSC